MSISNIDGIFSYAFSNSLDGIQPNDTLGSEYLSIDGYNMMMADLNMNNHNIKNLGNATTNDQAVNLGQISSTLTNYVDLTTSQTIGGLKTFKNSTTGNGIINIGRTATTNQRMINMQNNIGSSYWSLGNSGDSTENFYIYRNGSTPLITLNYTTPSLSVSSPIYASGSINGAGGLFTNNIDMNTTNTIINCLDPVNLYDVATKNYVDNKASNYLLLSGGTMTGNITMNTNKITSSYVPVNGVDLTNKTYVDSKFIPWTTYTNTSVSVSAPTTWFNTKLYFLANSAPPNDNQFIDIKTNGDSQSVGTIFRIIVNPSSFPTNIVNVSYSSTTLFTIPYSNFNQEFTLTKVANNNNVNDWSNINTYSNFNTLSNVLLYGNSAGSSQINMNGNKITSLSTGTIAGDAVNYGQLTSTAKTANIGTYYNISAQTLTLGPYGDITQIVKNVNSIVATGGITNIFTDVFGTTWKCHLFSTAGSNSFVVSNLGTNGRIDLLMIGAGGSGSSNGATSSYACAGAGAGELVIIENLFLGNGINTYPITVAPTTIGVLGANGNNGSSSSFNNLVSGQVYSALGGQGGGRSTVNSMPSNTSNIPSGLLNSSSSAGTGTTTASSSVSSVLYNNNGMVSPIINGNTALQQPIYTNAYTYASQGSSGLVISSATASGAGGGATQNGGVCTVSYPTTAIGAKGGDGALINFHGTTLAVCGGSSGTSSGASSSTINQPTAIYGAGLSQNSGNTGVNATNYGSAGGSVFSFVNSGSGYQGLVIVRYRLY